MKRIFSIFSAVITVCGLFAQHELPALQPISRAEAMDIVREEEEAKERAKDERDAELLSAQILDTAVADLDGSQVIFNRVEVHPKPAAAKSIVEPAAPTTENIFQNFEEKEFINLSLSGTVWDEAITEFWWNFKGERYKIFANVNGLYFQNLDRLESGDRIYSYMLFLAAQSTEQAGEYAVEEEWRPTLEDFTPGEIEYFVVQSGGDGPMTEEALQPIQCLLEYYLKNHDEMKVAYDNAHKIREARAAYLKMNPPKKRPVIINYSHTKNSRYLNSDQ